MPWSSRRGCGSGRRTPRAFLRRVSTCVRDTGSAIGWSMFERRGVVVLGGHRQVGATHRAAGLAQTVEGLRAGHLVHQVQIDVEEIGLTGRRVHDMCVPDLLAQRLRHDAVISSVVCRGCAQDRSRGRAAGVVAMVRRWGWLDDLRSSIRDGSIKAWTTLAASASWTKPLSCSAHWRPGPPRWPVWCRRPGSPDPPPIGSPLLWSTTGWSAGICRAASSSARGSASSPRPPVRTGCWPPPGRCWPGSATSPASPPRCSVGKGDVRVCVATAERMSGLRDTVPVGTQLTMNAGSAAQVLLAWEEPERLQRGLRGSSLLRGRPGRRTSSWLGPLGRRAGGRAWPRSRRRSARPPAR